jgi:hypothetical protein
MNIDCAWFTSRLEAYCCDNLDEPDRQAAQQHLNQCRSCKSELDSLEKLDDTLRQVFQHRLSQALSQPPTRIRFIPAAVGAATAVTVLVLALTLLSGRDAPSSPATADRSAPEVSVQESVSASAIEGPKNTVEPPIQRAKPGDDSAIVLLPRPDLDTARADGADFAVIDAAGYSTSLDNYKGYSVVIGVWSANQPQTVDTMNRIYSAFGHDPQVRVLGVASARQEPLDRATFPVVFNRGSQLLGLKTGELVLIDKAGQQRWSGSLTEPPDTILSKIKSEIESVR